MLLRNRRICDKLLVVARQVFVTCLSIDVSHTQWWMCLVLITFVTLTTYRVFHIVLVDYSLRRQPQIEGHLEIPGLEMMLVEALVPQISFSTRQSNWMISIEVTFAGYELRPPEAYMLA